MTSCSCGLVSVGVCAGCRNPRCAVHLVETVNGYGVYRTVNGSVGNVAGLYSLPLEYQRQVVDAFGAGLPRCIECCSAAARDGVAKVRGAQAEAEREAAELDAWYAAGEPERRRRFPEVVGQLAKHLSSLGYPTTEGVRVHKAPAYRRKGLFSTRVPFGDAWQVVGPIGPGWFYEVRSSGTSSDHGLAYRLQSGSSPERWCTR